MKTIKEEQGRPELVSTIVQAYMELFIVLAFFVGWYILEKVANSYDRDKTKSEAEDPQQPNDQRTRQDPS